MASSNSNFWQWIRTFLTTWFTRAVIAVLSAGPMPDHIAIVMDGNRRYARTHHKLVQEGHTDGFYALHRILEICLRLRIKCITVYAFSIENFKRPPVEVDALMELAKNKLIELSDQKELLHQYGVRLNVIGRKELLPKDVREVANTVEDMTRNNSNAILNICMPYTSRDEMTTAVEASRQRPVLTKGKRPDSIEIKDITESDINSNLLTNLKGSPPLDILIRTSGTNRLSDFLLWQASENVQIHFTDVYWPDFGLRDMVPILLSYQRKQRRAKSSVGEVRSKVGMSERMVVNVGSLDRHHR